MADASGSQVEGGGGQGSKGQGGGGGRKRQRQRKNQPNKIGKGTSLLEMLLLNTIILCSQSSVCL